MEISLACLTGSVLIYIHWESESYVWRESPLWIRKRVNFSPENIFIIAFVSQWCFTWKTLITSTFFQTYSNPFFKLTWYFRSFAWILPLKRARGGIDYAIGDQPVITDLFMEEEKETLYNDRAVSFPKISQAWNPASKLARTAVCICSG